MHKLMVCIALASLVFGALPAASATASGATGAATTTAAAASGSSATVPSVSQAQALAGLTALFPQLAKLPVPQVQSQPDYLSGQPLWQFVWPGVGSPQAPGPGAFATVDGMTGKLVSAVLPQAGRPRATPLTLGKAQALAEAFLAKTIPDGTAGLIAQEPQVNLRGNGASPHVTYAFSWLETVGGVPVLDAAVSVEVDALTGEVASFNRQIIPDMRFPPTSQAMPANRAAAAAFAGEGLVLAYDSPGTSAIIPDGGGPMTLHPVWELASTQGIWDATTGAAIATTDELPQVASVATAPAELAAAHASAQGAPITEDQARSEAEKIVQLAGYTGWTATQSGTAESVTGGITEQYWSIQFQPPGQSQFGMPGLNVEISQDGQFSQMFPPLPLPSSATAAPTQVTDDRQATAVASAFLQAVDPTDAADTVVVPAVANSLQGAQTWQVRFARVYDGIPVAPDAIDISVDPQGQVVSYMRTWHDLTPSGGEVPLLDQTSAEKTLAGLPVELGYELRVTPASVQGGVPQPKTPALVYAFRDARNELAQVQLDAVNGQVYGADGAAFDASGGPPQSIRGSWAETPLWALSEEGLLPAGAGPNDPVTLGAAIHALLATLQTTYFGGATTTLAVPPGPYGSAVATAISSGIVPPGAASEANRSVSRQEITAWTVRALGYGALLGMPNRVAVHFSDASAIAPQYVNAVGIAQGLGIVLGAAKQRFSPLEPVTWAQLAAMLMRAAEQGPVGP